MDLIIKQNCPSCGAAIELHEADRLLLCPFCDVRNFMIPKGPLRFVLPHQVPTDISLEDIFYFPYLRFKGKLYFTQLKELGYKIVDTTYIGLLQNGFPPSLGLRPQAMKLYPVTHTIQGKFVKKSEKTAMIFQKAAKISEIGKKNIRDVHTLRSFVGETISIIYLPVYYKNGRCYDGVLNNSIGKRNIHEPKSGSWLEFQNNWNPQFITTICPGCGDTLDGEHDSVILSCKNCHSSFQELNGRFVKIDWQIVLSKSKEICYLPFWKIQVVFKGVPLVTFADLLRLTNQPVVVREDHEQMLASFVIPAFKIRPKTFLRVAGALTLSQAKISNGEAEMVPNMHPVTLAASEAEQAILFVFAAITGNKVALLPLLPEITVRISKVELLYLPFVDQGHDIVQEQTGVSIISNILRFGRSL